MDKHNKRKGGWGYHAMWMPVLSKIPGVKKFMQFARRILDLLPRDIIEPVFCLSALLIWCRITVEPRREHEQALLENDNNRRGNSEVPHVGLLKFVAYLPHVFKHHEHYKLAAYAHPFRVINDWYRKDQGALFEITSDIRLETEIQGEYLKIANELEFRVHWLAIVPSSMPGSQIPEWANLGFIEPQSLATRIQLCLPDIHTLGLSEYKTKVQTRSILYPTYMLTDKVRARETVKSVKADHYISAKQLVLPTHADDYPLLATLPALVVYRGFMAKCPRKDQRRRGPVSKRTSVEEDQSVDENQSVDEDQRRGGPASRRTSVEEDQRRGGPASKRTSVEEAGTHGI